MSSLSIFATSWRNFEPKSTLANSTHGSNRAINRQRFDAAGQLSALGQESPIRAIVGAGGANALGGPDEVHYATSSLEPETEVLIFRLDPGRWCAIRPPSDSFSLVRATAISILDEERGIGEVITDEERCWIGTLLGQVDEPLWQIKLNPGERVRVLGSIPSAQDPDQPEWYQIAPPSGEFRWMHWSDLDEASRQRSSQPF